MREWVSASGGSGRPRWRRSVPFRAGSLVLAASLAHGLAACCRLENRRYPVEDPPNPATTFLVYGDSLTFRHGGVSGYALLLAPRIEALGEAVAIEGRSGREAGIGAIPDPVNDRCPSRYCQLYLDCLADNPPLVTVLKEHPNARRLVVTLGGVELLEGLHRAYGETWRVPDPANVPPDLEEAAYRVLENLAGTLDIALADRAWVWIGVTSYLYMPTDSSDPVVPCPLPSPIGAADQKVMNDLMRTLDRLIRAVAEEKGVRFVSLLDALGGGESVPGGENGPPGALFEDCGHPWREAYEAVAERIFRAIWPSA